MSRSSKPKRILITGSGGPMGVNVTRSLRLMAERPHLVGTECNHYHTHLSLTDHTELIPPARELEPYLEAMLALIAREGIEMVLPTHPVEVRTLSANRDRLPEGIRIEIPDHETILRAQDKWRTNQILAGAGVNVPRTFLIEREEDIAGCFEAIASRPLWVRGSGVPGVGVGVASLPCREPRHAIAWIDYWNGWGKFIASEYLPGRNLTWGGLFFGGELVACQGRERLEYVIPHVSPSGITGAPAVSRTVTEPALRATGEAAVRAIADRPHGYFFVDMTEDPTGVARVTEINAGRFGTTIHFYSEAGFNLPQLLVQLAFGEDPIAPSVGAPSVGAPSVGAPSVGAPSVGAPSVGAPSAGDPSGGDASRLDPIPPGTYWIRTLDCGPALVRPGELREEA